VLLHGGRGAVRDAGYAIDTMADAGLGCYTMRCDAGKTLNCLMLDFLM
jgi:hypothetical protein